MHVLLLVIMTLFPLDKTSLSRLEPSPPDPVRLHPPCRFDRIWTAAEREECRSSTTSCVTPSGFCASDALACHYMRVDAGALQGLCYKNI